VPVSSAGTPARPPRWRLRWLHRRR
jgi:hypothetical protein